ncbi:MAG: 2-amino-4-hydroxy-6-hydroxymethyldihydropteridine diphosphokinase [Planctomycetota bacterium]|jgi:2-amino-4-hydroxy-6-hydroxymethyldihydropteridine diphosphokinase
MPRYLLLLGSNIEPEMHLPGALRELEQRYEVRDASRVVESDAVCDSDEPRFRNQAVLLRSDLDTAALREELRALEAEHGRVRTENPNAPRTLDVDIILRLGEADTVAGDPVPDAEPLRHHYGALTLADVLPEAVVEGLTLAEHRDALGAPPETLAVLPLHDEAGTEA